MWGSGVWGIFFWGASAPSVPLLTQALMLVLAGGLLGVGFAMGRDPRARRWLFGVGLFLLPALAGAQISQLIVFTNGTIADADDVNANFSFHDGRLDALEADGSVTTNRIADLAVTPAKIDGRSGGGLALAECTFNPARPPEVRTFAEVVVCPFGSTDVDDLPDCSGVIPGTFCEYDSLSSCIVNELDDGLDNCSSNTDVYVRVD